jgi:hypothetical protein
VFNLKWSALSAAFGFALSLLLGLISGAGVMSLLRALIFGVGFFLLGSLLYWMVKCFLPELGSQEEDAPGLDMGSHVDISLDTDDDVSSLAAALREDSGGDGSLDAASGGFDGLDGLDGLAEDSLFPENPSPDGGFPAGLGLDQGGETGYTDNVTGLSGEKPAAQPSQMPPSQAAAVIPVEGTDALDMLPNLDNSPQAFSPSFGDLPQEDDAAPLAVAFPGVKRNSITPEEGEEFRGKEKDSALAIQTILKRD